MGKGIGISNFTPIQPEKENHATYSCSAKLGKVLTTLVKDKVAAKQDISTIGIFGKNLS